MKNKFNGKKVLVYGLGRSGFSSCKLLHKMGACVSTYDDECKNISDSFSFVKEPLKRQFDFVVVSPGVKVLGNKILDEFKLRKVKILSELDLGYMFCKGKIVAVTGTNGKTTTCMLLGQILAKKYNDVVVCGNIGLPLTSICETTTKDSVTVVEVSSFQLELSKKFHADIRVLLNITTDHIDRHGSFEEYKNTKLKLFANKRLKDKNIINFDDDIAKTALEKDKKIWTSKLPIKNAVCVKNHNICYKNKEILNVDDISLLGDKNLENVLCAVAVAKVMKVKNADIRDAVSNFRPAGHRMEEVGIISGARFIDDSKATNISSTQNALSAVDVKNTILFLGGQSKGYTFSILLEKCHDIKCIFAFGECGKEIYEDCKRLKVPAMLFDTMKEASMYARSVAMAGEIYLLSPACASFDEFSSYAERGDVFKEIVLGDGYEAK